MLYLERKRHSMSLNQKHNKALQRTIYNAFRLATPSLTRCKLPLSLVVMCVNNEIEVKTDMADRDTFIEGVRQLFPESFHEMEDIEDELLHIDMADFSRTTNNAIRMNNTSLAKEHFQFIGQLFQKANPDLENAIIVSYLENIFIGESEAIYLAARKLLPPNLAKALTELEGHFDKLYESSKNT